MCSMPGIFSVDLDHFAYQLLNTLLTISRFGKMVQFRSRDRKTICPNARNRSTLQMNWITNRVSPQDPNSLQESWRFEPIRKTLWAHLGIISVRKWTQPAIVESLNGITITVAYYELLSFFRKSAMCLLDRQHLLCEALLLRARGRLMPRGVHKLWRMVINIQSLLSKVCTWVHEMNISCSNNHIISEYIRMRTDRTGFCCCHIHSTR